MSHLGPLWENLGTIHKPKENSHEAHNLRYAYNTIIGSKHYWIDGRKQLEPKCWSAQNSNSWIQPVRRSHQVRNWSCQGMGNISAAGGAHAMPNFTKKRRTTACHLFQRDKSNQDAIFKLFKHLQLIPALHSTGNNEFWYCSRNRLMHNNSKITGSNQDILEMKKYDGRPITMSIPVPKGLRE